MSPPPAAVATAASPADGGSAIQTLPKAGNSAGSTSALGGLRVDFDIKRLLLFAAGGAALGMLVPVIPGGPLGGAAIGAAIAMLLR